jgi:hypothetical protein
MKLTTHLHVILTLKMCGTLLSHRLCVVWCLCGALDIGDNYILYLFCSTSSIAVYFVLSSHCILPVEVELGYMVL